MQNTLFYWFCYSSKLFWNPIRSSRGNPWLISFLCRPTNWCCGWTALLCLVTSFPLMFWVNGKSVPISFLSPFPIPSHVSLYHLYFTPQLLHFLSSSSTVSLCCFKIDKTHLFLWLSSCFIHRLYLYILVIVVYLWIHYSFYIQSSNCSRFKQFSKLQMKKRIEIEKNGIRWISMY